MISAIQVILLRAGAFFGSQGRIGRRRRSSRSNESCLVRSSEPVEPRLLLSISFDVVSDMNPEPVRETIKERFTEGDEVTYFVATQPTTGAELWRTVRADGTTELVRDLNPGPGPSAISGLTVVGNIAYFFGMDHDGGPHVLWQSDGTREGTQKVTFPDPFYQFNFESNPPVRLGSDLYFVYDSRLLRIASASSAAPARAEVVFGGPSLSHAFLVASKNRLFFKGADDSRLRSWQPGEPAPVRPSLATDVQFLSIVGSRMIFRGRESIGSPLVSWITDGTPASAMQLPFPEHVYWPSVSVIDAERFRFLVTPDGAGPAVWQSNGTPAGTFHELDLPFNPFGNVGAPEQAIAGPNGTIYMLATAPGGRRLVRTNGTSAGTVSLDDPQVQKITRNSLQRFGDGVIVTAITDFGPGGTRRMKIFNAGVLDPDLQEIPVEGTAPFQSSVDPINTGAALYWRPTAPGAGRQIWTAIPSGPLRLLKEFSMVTGDSYPYDITEFDGFVFGISLSSTFLNRVFRTDGTDTGTLQTQPHANKLMAGDEALFAAARDDRLYVTRDHGLTWTRFEDYWGQRIILQSVQRSRLYFLDGHRLLTVEADDDQPEAVSFDGTPTQYVLDTEDVDSDSFAYLMEVGDRTTGIQIVEQSSSDSRQIHRLQTPDQNALTGFLRQAGHRIVWQERIASTTAPVFTRTIWSSNGTDSGTVPILSFENTWIEWLAADSMFRYFRTTGADGASAIWRTDGTTVGTMQLAALPGALYITHSAAVSEKLFIAVANTDTVNPDLSGEVWVCGEGVNGLQRIASELRNRMSDWDSRIGLYPAFGKMYFWAGDAQSGIRLWTSNGTVEGTHPLLTDALQSSPPPIPGATSGFVTELIGFKGQLFYAGVTDEFGLELVRVSSSIVENAPEEILLPNDDVPRLEWQDVFGAAQYEVQIVSLNLLNPLRQTMVVASAEMEVPADFRSGAFRVWIRGLSSTGAAGPWNSTLADFDAGSRPVLYSLPLTTTDSTPRISWANPAGTTSSEIWIGERDLNTRVLLRTVQGSVTSLETPALLPGRYVVWVRSSLGIEPGDWSVRGELTILAPAPIVTDLSNASSYGAALYVDWLPVPGTTEYEIHLRLNNSNIPPVVIRRSGALSSTFVRNLPDSGTWTVQLRALRNGRPLSAWSGVSSLLISVPPFFKLNLKQVSWQIVNETVGYELEIRDRRTNAIVIQERLPASQTTYDLNLPPQHYSISMRSVYEGNVLSLQSLQQFEVFHPRTPILSGPVSTVDATPVIRWAASPAAARYDLFVALQRSPSNAVYRRSIESGSSHRIPVPLAAGEYFVWVQRHFANGSRSLWGEGSALTIGAPPIVKLQGSRLFWNTVNDATRYHVILQQLNPDTGRYDDVARDSLTLQNHLLLSQFSPGSFRFWVRALRDEAGVTYVSDWSTTLLFDRL